MPPAVVLDVVLAHELALGGAENHRRYDAALFGRISMLADRFAPAHAAAQGSAIASKAATSGRIVEDSAKIDIRKPSSLQPQPLMISITTTPVWSSCFARSEWPSRGNCMAPSCPGAGQMSPQTLGPAQCHDQRSS